MGLAVLLFGAQPASAQDCTNPDGSVGDVIYNNNYDVFQSCSSQSSWMAFHEPQCPAGDACDPCHPTKTPSPGRTCKDGSVYAGLSPDGNVQMFTTPADAPSTYTWNDGSGNVQDTAMENCTDDSPGTAASCQTGEENTVFLVEATGEPDYPFAAAVYCDGLSDHGKDDWYLPAQDELNMLYTNKNSGDLDGTFEGTSGSFYWTSSEQSASHARRQRFSDGLQTFGTKSVATFVRCVRK